MLYRLPLWTGNRHLVVALGNRDFKYFVCETVWFDPQHGQTARSEIPWEFRGEVVIPTVFDCLGPKGYEKFWWTLWKPSGFRALIPRHRKWAPTVYQKSLQTYLHHIPLERKFNAASISYKNLGLKINILGITLPESNMIKLLLYSPFNPRHLAKYISTLKLFCNNAIFVPNSSLL